MRGYVHCIFRAGDMVRCINTRGVLLEFNSIHVVTRVSGDDFIFLDDAPRTGFLAERFVLESRIIDSMDQNIISLIRSMRAK